MQNFTTKKIREMKGEKIAVLTAYDYPTAKLADECGCDIILVGDSLGNVILGYENTTRVTMDDMLHHTAAAARGTKRALLVGDMPFLSYHLGEYKAVENAGRFISQAGASAVKMEGGREISSVVRACTTAGIPVMGHLGLLPQSVNQIGGFSVQAKTESAAATLIEDAKILEDCGSFAIVLECIPAELAAKVTESIGIPTIGIGAGPHCDGQVLVTHDMLGLCDGYVPSFVKKYANLHISMKEAMKQYVNEVRNSEFPSSSIQV